MGYRKQIMPKYKKKIESIVRHSYKQKKRENEWKEEETMSDCPFCKIEIPSISLYCKLCKQHIPFCIVTGQHMLANDWSHCPECSFPALHSKFVEHANNGFECTMCKMEIDPQQIKLCNEPPLFSVAN